MKSAPFVLIDCNNFYSPSGGGVRRYHLQKLDYFSQQDDVMYIHVQPGAEYNVEEINETTFIVTIPAFKIPGEWDYRYSIRSKHLKRVFKTYKPDAIEIGSPYFMPWLVKNAIKGLEKRPKLIGFWHSDFPITYMRRSALKYGEGFANFIEEIGWKYARRAFKGMDKIYVPSRLVEKRLHENKLTNTQYMPLGVNTELFNPNKKDLELIENLKAGEPNRLTVFFPHRFSDEKGLKLTLSIYPKLCEKLDVEPAFIFAGTGPDLNLVEKATKEHPHIRFLGFVKSDDEMARWNASCEMGLALSGWETFGLSILEAMASGQILVGANSGAALEHITESDCGLSIDHQSEEELLEAILRLYNSEDKLERSKRATDYAAQKTWGNCFERELKTYKEI